MRRQILIGSFYLSTLFWNGHTMEQGVTPGRRAVFVNQSLFPAVHPPSEGADGIDPIWLAFLSRL